MSKFFASAFGAVGDGRSDDGPALQAAIDACYAQGGGCVVVEGGRTYSSSALRLKSRVEFHLESGAVLKVRTDPQDFVREVPNGSGRRSYALLWAFDADDISVTGQGTIDGSYEAFQDVVIQHHIQGVKTPRPFMMYVENCRRLTIKGVTFRNTPTWTIHPAGCRSVLIEGIRIENDLKMANSDGIDPDHCSDVRIANCSISCADDCIVIKNTRDLVEYGPCENIVITGCTLRSTSAAFKIGSESVSDFRNIVMDACVIYGTNRGLGIQLRDEGNVENVMFSNIVIETRRFYDRWWGKAEPLYVTSFGRNEAVKESGHIKNVVFRNILCRGENGAYLCGTKDNPLEDIVLDGVKIELVKWTKWPGGVYDPRPRHPDGLVNHPSAGIYSENIRGLTLRHVKVTWAPNPPETFGSALEAHGVEDLVRDHFVGQASRPGLPDVVID